MQHCINPKCPHELALKRRVAKLLLATECYDDWEIAKLLQTPYHNIRNWGKTLEKGKTRLERKESK